MSYAYPLDSVVTYDALGTPQYDRAVTSETLRSILHVMLTDGVFLEDDIDMQVTATGSMNVQVGKGYCVVRGAQKIFETANVVQIPASNTLNRIDTIVARLDLNQDVRDVVLDVVKGTPSSTPVAPELTRTSSIWEIGLANVKVTANSSVIAQENITDTRLDTNRCGLVSSLMSFDTTSLYDQIQADLLTFKDVNEADFENWSTAQKNEWLNWIALNEADFLAWYQRMKDQLSEDAAGNLQLQIDALNSDLSGRIDNIEAEMPFAGGSKVNINFEYDVIPNIQYSNEHYKLTVGDTVRENNFSSSKLHFDEYGILTVGDGVLEVTYDITDLRTGKITPVSYTYTINMPYFGRFAYNVTISANLYNYQGWLYSIDKDPSQYSTIEDVFSDEKLLRELMTRHASVEYLVEWLANNNEDAHTVLNNDYCAKWINLRDYALDKLYANPTVKAVMDEVDKYGYGEWALIDGKWQPKGAVPVMTSDTAPYGKAFGSSILNGAAPYYKAFNGINSEINEWWHSAAGMPQNVGYKFTNPVNVRRFCIKPREGFLLGKLQGSLDGTNWVDLTENVKCESETLTYFDTNNTDYYLYYRFYISDSGYIYSGNKYAIIYTLQFYGRLLNVSVPKMTSDTAPWGEVKASSVYSGRQAYYAFNGSIPDYGYETRFWYTENAGEQWIQYDFERLVRIKKYTFNIFTNDENHTVQLVGSKDGVAWFDLENEKHTVNATSINGGNYAFDIDVENEARYIRIKATHGSRGVAMAAIQFYGLDYSEREFEEGSTMKYIYDHGVELESITVTQSSATAEKQSDCIYLKKSGTSVSASAKTTNTINLTSYKLARIIAGLKNSKSGSEYGQFATYNGGTRLSYANIVDGLMPSGYMDISSVSQSANVGMYLNSTSGSVTYEYSLAEMWLE